MEKSSHMRKRYDEGSRCAQILAEVEERFFQDGPDALWLEWSPPRLVARRNGCRIRKINGNGWKLSLKVEGEPKHVVRISHADGPTIGQIESFLRETLKINSKEKKMTVPTKPTEPPAPAVSLVATPPVEGPKPAATEKRFGTGQDSIEYVLMAIEDIIRIEKLVALDGWYCIEKFNSKVLAVVAPDGNHRNLQQALATVINKLVVNRQLMIQRQGREQRVKVRLTTIAPAQEPPAQPPAISPNPACQEASTVMKMALSLKSFTFSDLRELQKVIYHDDDLKALFKFLLSQ